MSRTPVTSATVWTADCSATVDLSRCQGPRAGHVPGPRCWVSACGERPDPRIDLSQIDDKAQLYECVLAAGSQFDIYRWINLDDLVTLWPRLRLPAGLRAEWARVVEQLCGRR